MHIAKARQAAEYTARAVAGADPNKVVYRTPTSRPSMHIPTALLAKVDRGVLAGVEAGQDIDRSRLIQAIIGVLFNPQSADDIVAILEQYDQLTVYEVNASVQFSDQQPRA